MAETSQLVNLAMHVVALLIAVAVVVLVSLESIDATAAISLLGVGLAALALGSAEV